MMFPVLTALFITMYNSMKVDVLTFTFGENYWAFEVYSCRVKFITMYKVVQTLSLWLKSFSWKPKGIIPFAFVLKLFIIARMKLKLLETNTLY